MRKRAIFFSLFLILAATVAFAACTDGDQNAKYIISFNTDGGSEVDSIILNAGEGITLPDPPVKEGYVFLGWFTDSACTRPVNVDIYRARSNATIFAGWESVETYPHAITLGGSQEGMVTLVSPSEPRASMGTQVTVRVTPSEGYEAVSVTAVGNDTGAAVAAVPDSYGTNFTFSMPSEPVTVNVVFELRSYSVTVSSSTSGGAVVLSQNSAQRGDTVTFKVIPDFGYKFTSAYLVASSGTYSEIENASFTMPAGDVSVTAVFEPIDQTVKYSVSALSAEGGALTVYADSASEGEYVYYSVNAAEGYLLDRVTLSYGDVRTTLTETPFLMPAADVVLEAVFRLPLEEETSYRVSIGGLSHGTVALMSDDNEFFRGEKVELYIEPDDGYIAAGITVNGVYVDGNSFFMPASDAMVTVDFRFQGYSVSFSDAYRGFSVEGAPSYAPEGARVTFKIKTADGYGVIRVALKYDSDDSEIVLSPLENAMDVYSFVMRAEPVLIEVEARAGNPYPIYVSECEGGSISVDAESAAAGSVVDYTVTAEPGYRLKEGSFRAVYSVGGAAFYAATGGGAFVMPGAEVTLEAEFERVYSLRGIENEYMSVIPSVSNGAPGETVTFTIDVRGDILPDSVYLSLTVSGIGNVELGYVYSYMLPAFVSDGEATVSVNVPDIYDTVNSAYSYYLYIESTDGGSVSTNYISGARVPFGSEVVVSVYPDDGYVLSSLTIFDGSTETAVSDVFYMPGAGVTLRAAFEPQDAAGTSPESIYALRRDEFFAAGIRLNFYGSAAGLSETWLGYPLLGYVTGALSAESEYGYSFFLLHADSLDKVSPIAATAYEVLSNARDGHDIDVHIDHNSIVLAVDGDAAEAYEMLKNGLYIYQNMILYRRADFSYGLYALTDSPEYLSIPTNVNGRAVSYIARGALSRALNLSAVYMGGVREIADYAFDGLDKLRYLDLGSVESIGVGAFIGCTSIEKFFVSSSNSYYFTDSRGALYADLVGTATALVAYPAGNSATGYALLSSAVEIAAYGFSGARFLQTLSYGSALTAIGDYAFDGAANLSLITYANVGSAAAGTADLGQSQCNVASVGDHAFRGTSLTVFRFGRVTYLGSGAVEWDGSGSMTIYLNTVSKTEASFMPVVVPESYTGTLRIVTGRLFDEYAADAAYSYLTDFISVA